jgi:hypothetical protein
MIFRKISNLPDRAYYLKGHTFKHPLEGGRLKRESAGNAREVVASWALGVAIEDDLPCATLDDSTVT